MEGLRGHTTGYGVPTYVVDAPGGGGKIPLQPQYVVGRQGEDLILRNYEGREYRYPDPLGAEAEIATETGTKTDAALLTEQVSESAPETA
jgi:lysine 2,3-aminomutase